MRRALFGLMVLTLASAPERNASAAESRKARDNRCDAVSVEAAGASSGETPKRQRHRQKLVAHQLLDLELTVWLPEKSRASLVEIHVFTPAGRLYDVLQATASAGSDDRVRLRRRRARVVSARLPVAGSHIVSRSLYGTWRADVFLDGNEESCTRRATEFTIEP